MLPLMLFCKLIKLHQLLLHKQGWVQQNHPDDLCGRSNTVF
jgi:hypothetical protein